jgi:hypothetical protein
MRPTSLMLVPSSVARAKNDTDLVPEPFELLEGLVQLLAGHGPGRPRQGRDREVAAVEEGGHVDHRRLEVHQDGAQVIGALGELGHLAHQFRAFISCHEYRSS